MLNSILRQFTGCREDDAVDDVLGRATWAPIASPHLQSSRYTTIREYTHEKNNGELERDYQEVVDNLEKECRLANSRAKVAMRIHAREQDIQRKVNVALARAKRAEGLVAALRHENASLRSKLKMLDETGMNPTHHSSSRNNSHIETPTTKTRRVSMLSKSSASVDTPPTQRGDYVAKKMSVMAPTAAAAALPPTTTTTTTTTTTSAQQAQQKTAPPSFLDVISSDLPRVAGAIAKTKTYKNRQPLSNKTNTVDVAVQDSIEL